MPSQFKVSKKISNRTNCLFDMLSCSALFQSRASLHLYQKTFNFLQQILSNKYSDDHETTTLN